MGNHHVTFQNETPYTFSYSVVFQINAGDIKASGQLAPGQSARLNYLDPSIVYLKYGFHSQETVRYNPDLFRHYNPIDEPTFFIRVRGHDQSTFELSCDRGGDSPTCPNYGKMEEDQIRMENERKHREEEEARRQLEEERKNQEKLEREKQIQEEIEKEQKSLEGKLSKSNEKREAKRNQEAQFHSYSHILKYVVEDDALAIQTNEIKDIEEKFNKLLNDHNIQENVIMQSKNIAGRIMALQQQVVVEYSRKKQIPMYCLENLDDIFNYENLSLTENLNLLDSLINVSLIRTTDNDLSVTQNRSNMEEKTQYLLCIMDKLCKDSKTIARNVMKNIVHNFSPFSQELISQIIFNEIWTPVQAFEFYLEACGKNTPQDKVEQILHAVQTYQIPHNEATSALQENDPTTYLKKQIIEEDKNLNSIIQEMRSLGHPENLLSIVEAVLKKVVEIIPNYHIQDLDESMKNEGIQELRNLDLGDPNIESLVKILIGLSFAVEDTTSLSSGGKGYIPRTTQLASLLTLLLSKTSDSESCLLEIATGEGKSSLVAMFALILAIRGKTVDIVTSNQVLARRDQEEWTKLFEMFDVTCSVIPPKGLDECSNSMERDELVKKAYRSNVVYGTVDAFAADILRQEFEKKTTRENRKFDIVLVDEVDYMTLDNGVQITYLSHEATGMRHLDQLLSAVWARVCFCQRIQEGETDNILWTTGIQYFHKLTVDAVLGQEGSKCFNPNEILACAVQEGFLGEEDLQIINEEAAKSSASDSEALENNPIGKLIGKLEPSHQKVLLTIFAKGLNDFVKFKFYELENGKACFTGSSCDSDASHTISILLLEGGKACLLVTEKDLIDTTEEDISSKIKYSDTYKPDEADKEECFIILPGHLKEFTQNRFKVFVENALRALLMEKGRQYEIDSRDTSDSHESDCIIPIDFKSTGILEKNKRWGDGLQQFLELKHQLAMTPLSNVTNFMSNFHFFQRYANNSGVYGVSGTLGDASDWVFLKKHFKTSCYTMPTHRLTKKVEVPAIQVEGGKEAWITEICEHVKKRTSPKEWVSGQAVLVICEDVKTAEELKIKLIELNAISSPEKITLYTRNDKHNVEKRVFESGDVVLATNLGGRGTDIKVTKEVNLSGGLCVILTHFPANRRVEKQIFGRTSRKGNPGMVQMILNQEDLAHSYQGQPVEIMRERREKYEESRILEMENDELLEVNMRYELFTHFCQFLDEFEKNYSTLEKSNIFTIKDLSIYMSALSITDKLDYQPALNALKESWATWLTLHDEDINNHKNIMEMKNDLSNLLNTRSGKLLQGTSTNFYDFIKVAMDRTFLHMKDHGNEHGALLFWNKAQSTDPVYSAISLYNRAFITINLEKDNYKQEAINLLTEARKTLETYILEASNINSFVSLTHGTKFEPHYKDTNFTLQIQTRMSLLKAWVNYIENSLKMLQDLQDKNEDAITEEKNVYSLSENYGTVVVDELSLLYDYGLSFVFEVKKKPKFCIDALICFILGALQVLAGIVVWVVSCGAATQFAMGLISEGISDMIAGVEGMIKGTFDWAQWAISKAISIALSLVTAGFSLLQKAGKAVLTVAKDLIQGTKTLSTVAKEIAQSGKALISSFAGTIKTVASSVSKETVTQSIKTFASNATAKEALKKGAAFSGKELLKETTMKLLDYGIDEGLEAIFKEILKSSIKEQINSCVKGNMELEKALFSYIVNNGVPELVMQQENPSEFKVLASTEIQMKKYIQTASKGIVEESIIEDKTFDTVISNLSTASKFVIKILEDKKASGALIKGIKISVHIGEMSKQIADILNNLPTQSFLNDTIIPNLITSIDDSSSYQEDARQKLPNVVLLNQMLQDEVSTCISDEFIDMLAQNLTGLVKTGWDNPIISDATDELKKKAVHWLQKIPMKKFAIIQKINTKLEKSEKGEDRQETINDFVKSVIAQNDIAINLKLNVLSKSPLLNGRGIKLSVIQEDGKQLSTEYYKGSGSSEKDIQIQVKASTSNNNLNFNTLKSDGTVLPVPDQGENGLYQAVSHALSENTPTDVNQLMVSLKNGVNQEIEQTNNASLVMKAIVRQELKTLGVNYVFA
ncbi:uncharacterized protein LOC128635615 [Bombina bombina]|uniref:uncharacterized protein LOC128635615 n=1 Tax=Bombina bombina TaxID=8345 RepID=UPI00235AE3EF|nr:uncharacterized protein LOC128635615 [Bombina bombina]